MRNSERWIQEIVNILPVNTAEAMSRKDIAVFFRKSGTVNRYLDLAVERGVVLRHVVGTSHLHIRNPFLFSQ